LCSIRSAASCGQPRQEIALPRGARTTRAPGLVGGDRLLDAVRDAVGELA
jgi:hypothetical protein